MSQRLCWIAILLLKVVPQADLVVAFNVGTCPSIIRSASTSTSCSSITSSPRQQGFAHNSRVSGSSTKLFENKLWDRLSIEEDDEPYWYIINCVATNELDLLRQCRTITQDMTDDVVKFVVPLERKTRSHGARRMVTEEKVKYPGYVFAKLRLCPPVYEVIQSLDLCRSWMGNVNHKGYKKLPPVPIPLNEVEVENFGLDEIEELSDDNDGEDGDGIIVDSEEEYEVDPLYRGIDKEALQEFKGLKVEDMVKVTKQGKFFNEDGIVRRLKEGKIFVRFYTYGTLFEEWLDPGDVRKLTADEVRNGLGGPSQPITQRDLDGPSSNNNDDRYGGINTDQPGDRRQTAAGAMRELGGPQRNRRQDRVANNYSNGGKSLDEQRREDRNWNSYKEQQSQKQPRETITDQDWQIRPGSRDNGQNGSDKWAEGDVDSQWGRNPQRLTRENSRAQQNKRDIRQTAGSPDDWSSFVTSSPAPVPGPSGSSSEGSGADDFFASLMTDLSKDLTTSNGGRQQAGPQSASKVDKSSEDDFFASLMTDLAAESGVASTSKQSYSESTRRPERKQWKATQTASVTGQDDDFFALLEAELGTALDGSEASVSQSSGNKEKASISDETEAFFAQLEAELSTSLSEAAVQAVAPGDPPINAASIGAQARPKSVHASETSMDVNVLSKKTIPDLKDLLRQRGLKVAGKKAELVDRLLSSQ